jgi:(1->4)-alpha-D-glucan 1-alpha-D-glucosylmutase
MNIPKSTYRLQFNSSFGFREAKEMLPYVTQLGISWIYASPIFKARAGSMHGYDIVDQNQLNPELGLADDFKSLIEETKKHELGWLQDIVPNHMAYDYQNRMLIDLLENGEYSRYYNYFDIEWNHPHPKLKNRVLAPFLGKFYQETLEAGELKLIYDSDGFSISYYNTRLPIKISTYAELLSVNLDKLRNRLGKNNPDIIKLQGLLYVIKSITTVSDSDEMYDQIKFVKGILWELYEQIPEIRVYINEVIKIYNGNPGIRESFNLMDNLLSQQNFRLSHWKVANEEINYRRFFNVNDLISLKMEYEDAFNRTHSLILRFIRENIFNGLRIDHVDGLYNPVEYILRLRERAKDNYLIIEKILELKEELPSWPIQGTTGYDFMNYVNGVFCKSENSSRFDSIYRRFTDIDTTFEEIVYSNKRTMIKSRFAGEVERLAYTIDLIASQDRYGIDFTMNGLKKAIEDLLIYFSIYRTYIAGDGISSRDEKYLKKILQTAKNKNPDLSNEFNYIGSLLLLQFSEHFSEGQKASAIDFVMKFQQLTGPLMAKGFEDTTLYVYNRQLSLNEVGSNPGKFGITRREFHKFNKGRFKNWNNALNATSTHDTKRGEDFRARLNVLSEIPREWESKLRNWSKLNKEFKKSLSKKFYPTRNDEYFLYQTLIGSFPINDDEYPAYIERLKSYIIKAVREARVNSSWVLPNEEYENIFKDFIDKITCRNSNSSFLNDFITFQKKISYWGIFNSLSQVLLKITSPGIPDFYQGSELWDFSFVDPDNRRQVNYDLRKKYLEEMIDKPESEIPGYIKYLLENKENGKIKLFLINRALKLRNREINIFTNGRYIPLRSEGKYKKNIIAFARIYNSKLVVVVVPRFLTEIITSDRLPLGEDVWGETYISIPEVSVKLTNTITYEKDIDSTKPLVGTILKHFPVAILVSGN